MTLGVEMWIDFALSSCEGINLVLDLRGGSLFSRECSQTKLNGDV